MIKMKRVYEPAVPGDGYRILVDRLWPRGVSRDRADIGLWAKDIAPSSAIRKEFGHIPEMFGWFRQKYLEELSSNPHMPDFAGAVKKQLENGGVTFVYAAKDPIYNHVVILKDFIEKRLH
jgi:uncharacterized protein YeaO (DUF488 family)